MKYFITATDTGVGKTYVTASLIKFYKSHGYVARAIKPVETGCIKKGSSLIPEDATIYAKLTGQSIDEICLYKFETPVAPYVASELEKKSIDIEWIKNHVDFVYKGLVEKYGEEKTILFIEGAGGLLVPVTGKFMMIDFPKLLGAPVILISRLSLGTINHTLLSIEALENRKIPVKGVILNDALGLNTIAEVTNKDVLLKYLSVPILTVVQMNEDIKEFIL